MQHQFRQASQNQTIKLGFGKSSVPNSQNKEADFLVYLLNPIFWNQTVNKISQNLEPNSK